MFGSFGISSVLRQVVEWFLKKYLGKYVEGLDLKKLDYYGLSKGMFSFTNHN